MPGGCHAWSPICFLSGWELRQGILSVSWPVRLAKFVNPGFKSVTLSQHIRWIAIIYKADNSLWDTQNKPWASTCMCTQMEAHTHTSGHTHTCTPYRHEQGKRKILRNSQRTCIFRCLLCHMRSLLWKSLEVINAWLGWGLTTTDEDLPI